MALLMLAIAVLGAALYYQVTGPMAPTQGLPRKPSYNFQRADLQLTDRQHELAHFSPVLRLDLLEKYQSRPAAENSRDLFEFVESQTVKLLPSFSRGSGGAIIPATASPPQPSVPLRFLGYSESNQGVREVVLSDGTQIFVAREGDRVARDYKVVKISPQLVEIEVETLKVPSPAAYTVQVSAFIKRRNAHRLRDRLSRRFSPVFIQPFKRGDLTFYRVRVGRVPNQQKARELERELRRQNLETFIILDGVTQKFIYKLKPE